ncbi:MAG: acetolactate synthase small subunit [Candidatus Aquicultor secundus]|uniref:Acetolactate synthase small subunit n=1 Tax=Candidatus Aquicultor secundus TaxID=1973895 RepID=A0A2M7T7I0_9ACTN|nr:acetolactate synthase small subunit [Solirubrobacter sp.]OIO85722.1 MAG: acetolactate synthase small subunit [Candidatus Aquicultor secundus]PIU26772.1 MAG: acetolactate synthase small subunit [Candidatus Aquicultor secundus]PIW23255.1 MAG: acetolactate synthase small subunit [Candidatus Aquicultor secundus]PIX52255.1 MAG: acetolactate synthase small subunit [Candidatus Aquicultor secundus]
MRRSRSVKHILSVLVQNKPGVLARVSGLFSRRGFNIDSLAVGPTENPEVSRMTIVVDADDVKLEQITKQLYKLVNILKISDLDPRDSVERELVLIKVNAPPNIRGEVLETANIFRANIVDVSKSTLTIEITGTATKIQALEDLLRPYGIKELVRTGKIALARGKLAEA